MLPPLAGTCPAKMAFYCRGHPEVYSLGLALGCDRHSQYDLWHPNPLSDSEFFRGRTFILVGGRPCVASARPRPSSRSSRPTSNPPPACQVVAQWTVTICRGFRGFPQTSRSSKKCPILV